VVFGENVLETTQMRKLNLPEQTLEKLSQMLELPRGSRFDLLGFSLNLQKRTITDKLADTSWMELVEKLIPALLFHYSQGTKTSLAGKLVKFRELPGGYAYEGAFNERAINPVAQAFAQQPRDLPKAAKLVGGKPLNMGDYSVEITPLKGIPLTYILWVAEEFPASASILYDQSASSYLPTEDLAVLGELTTNRLLKAEEVLTKSA